VHCLDVQSVVLVLDFESATMDDSAFDRLTVTDDGIREIEWNASVVLLKVLVYVVHN